MVKYTHPESPHIISSLVSSLLFKEESIGDINLLRIKLGEHYVRYE